MDNTPYEILPAESSVVPDETETPLPGPGRVRHTIESLQLDLDEARAGRTWKLLPRGYRGQTDGSQYPLPTGREDLQKLSLIPLPTYDKKRDAGCLYLRRAHQEFRKRASARLQAVGQLNQRIDRMAGKENEFQIEIWRAKKRIQTAAGEVKAAASEAVATLTTLFELGRQGLDGQMRAHLDDAEWKGEHIDAKAFRDCFKMILQGVARLGLPSGERENAKRAASEELADALKRTREATALSAMRTEGKPQ